MGWEDNLVEEDPAIGRNIVYVPALSFIGGAMCFVGILGIPGRTYCGRSKDTGAVKMLRPEQTWIEEVGGFNAGRGGGGAKRRGSYG